MRRRLLAVFGLATAIGLLASVMVYRTLSGIAAEARPEPMEPIVVAAASMELGDRITAGHVQLAAWPRKLVPAQAIKTIEDADGRVVRASIVAGEPILEAKLAPKAAGLAGIMPMLVPDGQRAVTIKVDDAIRETGFVLPRSRVDVVAGIPRPGSQEHIAKIILQDVLVLAAGQTVELRDNKPVTVTTVTLALTPDQAERLALAQQEGRLTLTTRNLRDNRVVHTSGVTVGTLLSDTGPAPAARARAATPRAAAVPPPRAFTVSVLRAGKSSDHVFIQKGEELWVEDRR